MRIRTATVTFGALLATGMLLVGCDPNTSAGSSPSPTATVTAGSAKTSTARTAVPPLTGLGLQKAQDTAQADGFYNLTSHDASGADRMQILDRNWKVCTQTPTAGTAATSDVKIDLGAVKLDETCPGDAAPSPTPSAAASAAPTTHPATHKPAVHHAAPSRTGGSSGSSGSGGSTSQQTENPVDPGDGATAKCNDGTLSYSRHHRGTCSHHGGVAVWYK